MASKEELTEQLAVTTKLAAAVDQMAKSMSRVESSYDTQINAVEKLTRALEQLKGTDLSGLNSTKLDNVQKEFKETEKQATSLTGRLKDMGNWMAKKFPTSAAAGAAAISGFVQGMRNVIAIGKGVTGFLGGLVDTLFSVGAAIIAIPFKMFNALVDMAAQAGGGANELATAMENLRKEFGALSGPTPKTIITMSTTLKGFSDTGLSAWRVFGNLAKRIEDFTKLAVGMGATFQSLTKEFQANGGAILAYQKGLGISDEQMAAFGQKAIAQGSSISDVLKDTAKYALELGKAFGVDSKVISKDMAKAMVDVKHFAGATVKQIGEAATYARKLGVELDKIVGTLDAFETFDSAAENAAKLSQSFGVTVDAFKLMNAQDPADQLDQLRKGFLAAGKSADTMSRQELKLLAQTTGLDEATAKMAFSAKNQGLSLDEIKKKSGEAEKKTMTQAQAMGKLADSIERLVQSGGSQTGGFFDMFVKGFLGGIQASKEFREIIWNIKKSLQLVYMEGVKLGRAFVEMFPGVKDFLGGIADFFKPEKFKRLVGGVVDILKDWMKGLTDPNGKASFADLMDKLQKKFFGFFDEQDPAGKKMLSGFQTMIKTISKVLAEGIKWAADKMGEGIGYIIDLLTGAKKMPGVGAAEGGLGFLADVLAPLGNALAHAWDVLAPKVWELIKTLGKKLWGYLTSDEFISFIKPAIPYIAAALFGPALTRALMGALVSSIGKAAIGALSGSGGKALENVAEKAAQKALAASQKVSAAGGAGGTQGISQVGAVNNAAGKAIDKGGAGDKWGARDAVKLGLKLVAIAAAIAVGGVMMAMSIWAMKKILDSAGIKEPADVVPSLLVLGAMVVAAIPLMFAMKIASKVGSLGDVLKGGLIISVAVGIVGVVAAGIAYLMKKVADPAQLNAAGDIMLKMSLVFLAMVPLIFASMVIGALASGPQALALAAAAIGLGVIGVAVGEMAGITVGIIKELAALKVDSMFQRKVDAFLGVMKSIQAFADTLVKLVGLMTPSFTELLSGKATSFTEKVDKTVELIKVMIGQKGSGQGIIGIVELVMEKIKELNMGGPGLADSAKVFTEILTAVTEVTKSMTPPPEYFSAQTDFINVLDPSIGKSLDQTMKGYMQTMTANLKEVMTQVTETIKTLSALNIPNIEQAKVVAELVGSMGSILKALMPSPEALKSFTDTTEVSYAWGLLKGKSQNFNAQAATDVINTMGGQFKILLPALTSSVIKSVTDQAATLKKDDIEKIKVLADVLKISIDLTNALGNAMKGQSVQVGNVGEGASVYITRAVPNLAKVMTDMGGAMGPLLTAMVAMVKGVKIDKGFEAQVAIVSKIFGFLGEVPKMAASLADVQTKTGAGADITNTDPLVASVSAVAIFLGRLMGAAAFGTSKSPIQELMDNIKSLGAAGLDKAGAGLQKTVDSLTNLFKGVSSLGTSLKVASSVSFDATAAVALGTIMTRITKTITDTSGPGGPIDVINKNLTDDVMKKVKTAAANLTTYGAEITKVTSALRGDAIGGTLKAAADMVKSANDLDKVLNEGIPVNVPIKMSKLASQVGLGGKYQYSIKNKEVVINMNVQVTMNVDEVEKVLILRKNSFVRDRINIALEAAHVQNTNAQIPDNTGSPVPILGPGTK